MKSPADFWGPAVIIATAIVGWRWREHRLGVFATGLGVLMLLGVIQCVRSRPRISPRGNVRSERQQIGGVFFDSGRVFLSDQWTYTRGEPIEVPAGIYEVAVDVQRDGDGATITSLKLVSASAAREPRASDVRLSVDTGAAVIIDGDAANHGITVKDVREITARLMDRDDPEAAGWAMISDSRDIPRGIVVETGSGDGIYVFRFQVSAAGAEICASFS